MVSLGFQKLNVFLVSQNFKFPDHVGMPVGTSDSMKYLILETHFDNPKKSDSKCTPLSICK